MTILVDEKGNQLRHDVDSKYALISEVREFVNEVSSAESEFRTQALNELDYLDNKQWPSLIQQERTIDRRPTLTINKLCPIVNNTTNEGKMNRPAIKVHALGNGASARMAGLRQKLLKAIEHEGGASEARDRALECAVEIGRGFYRIYTDYENSRSFNQKIFYGMIFNPFSVYYDPFSVESNGSDCKRCAISHYYSPQEFKMLWPDGKFHEGMDFIAGQGDDEHFWTDSEQRVHVVEYYRLMLHADKTLLLADGSTLYESEMESYLARTPRAKQLTSVHSRETIRKEVTIDCVSGYAPLSHRVFPGEYIPVLPVYGNKRCVRGRTSISGALRNLIDTQHAYNYMKSVEVETIADAPRVQWVADQDSIKGFVEDYKSANRRKVSVLFYKSRNAGNGAALPPPQRVQFDANAPGAQAAAAGFNDDIKAISGVYDAALGAQGNETSGVGIENRQRQTNIGTYHYYDNLTKTIMFDGYLVNHIMGKVMDVERMERIINPDGTHDVVMLNERVRDPVTNEVLEIKNDMTHGEYDCVLDTGPSYSTARAESNETMLRFAEINPDVMKVADDLIAMNLDISDREALAERLAAIKPPEIQALKTNKGDDSGKIAALQMQIKNLTGQLQEAQNENTVKIELEHIKNQTAIMIEQMRSMTRAYVADSTNKTRLDDTELRSMVSLLDNKVTPPEELSENVKNDVKETLWDKRI